MVIDLDAHQGNGYERDFMYDANVFTCDMYNADIFPGDAYAMQGIDQQLFVTEEDNDESYLNKMRAIKISLE